MDISPLVRWATGCFVYVVFMFKTDAEMKHYPGWFVKIFKIVARGQIPDDEIRNLSATRLVVELVNDYEHKRPTPHGDLRCL
jgi:hypothetical protein